MAKTTERTKTSHSKLAEEAPTASAQALAVPPEKVRGTWENFQSELQAREREISALLPSHITPQKFMNTAIAAVKQNPEILKATQRSLFAAIIKSAQDGILPDGKEGFINIYNTKVSERGKPDRWELVASWSPMAYGLRKRARELDGILIDAQVVYKNDLFKRVQGDHPAIIHEPVAFGEDAGPLVGCYAIFKREDGTILGRETMDAAQVAMVRAQSKATESLMWTKFETEGWRKSVIRRGMKAVPVSEKLESIIRRDDDSFDFGTSQADDRLAIPPPVRNSEFDRSPARHNKVLQEWTVRGNYAKTMEDLDAVRKGAKAALPADLLPAFEDFLNTRAEHIERDAAKVETQSTKGDARDNTAPIEAEIVDEDPKPDILKEHPYPEDDAPGEGRAKIVDLLHDATARLDACTKVGQVADLREEIEQEIPPAFTDLLKQWNDGCDAKQKMIMDARAKK